ncbi:mitogen-activated protein kinase kinase kinase 9 [Phytophthora pseudosyringae]|uniref:Mitogen-activated protein kinase kinase kinase 9 n=1 Tax=Phytophthora pseudosyringae TaxID=221518 RepID=A0A8T1VXJ4_9STRA|nr:mitogen-activated protein kinase kinase kinase 9 [Phytophthora pseudosyringae]
MDHPNVLKLYGASHCSRPALLVCEDASNGPLVNYLTRQRQLYAEKRRHADQLAQQWSYHNQRHALWSLFLQAAQGLKYLHEERKLVHSNLKSDNILVTADGHVKLADFGQGMLALQNLAVQDKNFRELGWRAPNCWQGKKLLRRPAFQDDIYSFGLCVLDVLVPSRSSLAPADASKHVGDEGFNPLEKSVLELIHDERHRKLIEGMCKPKPEDRLTLKKVISHMEEMCNAAAQEPADSSDCCIL